MRKNSKKEALLSKGENIYYAPEYFAILAKKRLPFSLFWSNITLGDLNRFSNSSPYDFHPKLATKNALVDNRTNGTSENMFSALKRNPGNKKVPLVTSVENLWTFSKGLRRQWITRCLRERAKKKN